MRGALLCIVALGIQATACTRRHVSADECAMMLTRYIDMSLSAEDRQLWLPEAQARGKRESLIASRKQEPSYAARKAQCEREVSPREFDCAMHAGNADEWEACIE